MQYNGLKFSFSLLAQPTNIATPKFPSIEIKPDNCNNQHPVPQAQVSVPSTPHRSMDKCKRDSKSTRMLQKYSHLTLGSTKERTDRDNRSVRSLQSTKSRTYYRSKTETASLSRKSNKNRHSTANLCIDTSPKSSHNRKGKDQENEYTLFRPKGARRQNNFMDSPSKPASQLRVHDKISVLRQSERKLNFIPDKGKSFKSILHKVKPVLHIKGRNLNNTRLQQMWRGSEGEKQVLY